MTDYEKICAYCGSDNVEIVPTQIATYCDCKDCKRSELLHAPIIEQRR